MSVKRFIRVEGIKGLTGRDLLGYWELEAGDTAQPLLMPRLSDKSLHVFPVTGFDWNGASVAMKQTNDHELGVWTPAFDSFDTEIVQTSNRRGWVILPNMFGLMPEITGGTPGTTKLRVALMGYGEQI